MEILYWHWAVLGLLLMLAEIFVPSFTIFWFGLGALAVSALLLLWPLSLTAQLFLWAIFSSLFLAAYFFLLKPRFGIKSKAGMSRETLLGEIGQVIRVPRGELRGMLRFTVPLLGSEEWSFICETPVQTGDRVRVREISGNTLIVEPVSITKTTGEQ